jgi:hypothetical protein
MPNIFGSQQMDKIDYLLQFYTPQEIEKYISKGNTLDNLYNSSQPQEIDIIQLQDLKTGEQYFVDSPDGWVPVTDIVTKPKKKIFTVTTQNNCVVHASYDHLFQKTDLSWIKTEDLAVGDFLLTAYGSSPVVDKQYYGNNILWIHLMVGSQ